MCIAFVCTDKWPTWNELESAARVNSHGAGIGWVNYQKKKVEWVKGLKGAKEISEIINSGKIKKYPAVIHFRIASIGDPIPELTHPFPVTQDASLDLSGSAPSVLFHNGTWSGWADKLVTAMAASGLDIPDGEWSDTRAMAWLIARMGGGDKALNFLYDNVNHIEPDRLCLLKGDGTFSLKGKWYKKDGFIASNEFYYSGSNAATPIHKPSQNFNTVDHRSHAGNNVSSGSSQGSAKDRAQIFLPPGSAQIIEGRPQGGNSEIIVPEVELRAILLGLTEIKAARQRVANGH